MSPTFTQPPPFNAAQAIRLARETLEIEALAVQGLSLRVGESLAKAVERI